MSVPSEPGLAFCYRHPGRETGVRCVRCERPICPDCMRAASVGFHCPDDARAGARSIRAPRTSFGAKVLASPPYATSMLALLNVAAYLVTGTQRPGTLRDPLGSALFQSWQLLPYYVYEHDEYYTLLTATFLHLSLLHIATNMISLAVVGPFLERQLGWWRFLAIYLVSGLGGSAAIYAFGDELSATVGASGAIYGLLGACLMLVRRLGLDAQWLVGVLVLNFAVTFSVPGISKLGHIGGFVAGALCALAVGGLPTSRERIATRVQAGGLLAVLGLVLVVVAVRTATFS